MSKIIGIDLGTTNSAMAVLEGGERVDSADTGGLERGKRGIHGQSHGVPFVRVALG